jgi:large subunit ribosomal protein L24
MKMVNSSKTRKQRKAHYNAPIHIRRRRVASHLSSELREEYGKRSIQVIKGDIVQVVRGDHDLVGQEGKVLDVDTQTGRLAVEGVTLPKADGTQITKPIHASNVIIMKLDLSDPWRKDKLLRKKEA